MSDPDRVVIAFCAAGALACAGPGAGRPTERSGEAQSASNQRRPERLRTLCPRIRGGMRLGAGGTIPVTMDSVGGSTTSVTVNMSAASLDSLCRIRAQRDSVGGSTTSVVRRKPELRR